MRRRSEKKISNLEIRISPSKKEAFMKACEENDTNASDAVRTFVDAYIAQSRQLKLKQIAKGIAMTILQNPVKSAAGFAAPVAGAVTATLLMTSPSVAQPEYVAPLSHPTAVIYPADMAEQEIEGTCDVYFSVDTAGRVMPGAKAECSHPGFEKSASDAVYQLRFEPFERNGKPVLRDNLIYPFSYELGD